MSRRYLRAARQWEERWSKRRLSALSERKGFGSFHSEDVEVLIRQSDAEFQVPSVHSAIQDAVLDRHHLNHTHALPMHDLAFRKSLFALDQEWTFLNHGAFGATLRPLLFESFLWREYCESQPLRFFDRELFPLIVHSLRQLAVLLHCDPADLLPLANVTAGLNAMCRTMEHVLTARDEVVHFSLTYGATKRMLGDLCRRTGATNKLIDLPLPLVSPEHILSTLQRDLSPRTRLVVIDTITSNTAVALPWQAMARLCKEANPQCVVVLDAAHSLFSQPVDLGDADRMQHVDLWMANGHKWLSAPKGCAVLWTNPRRVHGLRPAVLSHGFTASPALPGRIDRARLLSGFVWDGCRDYAAVLTLPTALRIWRTLAEHTATPGGDEAGEDRDGWAALRRHGEGLLEAAEQRLGESWRLRPEDLACPRGWGPAAPMRLVPLPEKVLGGNTRAGCTDKDAFQLQEKLHHDCRIEVPVKCLQGRLYVRISAHLYNSLEDVEKLDTAIRSWT